MRAVAFKEANTKLLPPEGEEENVYELPIWTDGRVVISKWRMSWRDRLRCLLTGAVWFHVQSRTHPPVSIETDFPFIQERWSRRKMFIVVLIASLFMWAIIGAMLWQLWVAMGGN